ncbi:MAG: AAA family ATPase [Nitrospinota bacterium]|nr:MAG: AAA family ATPase [Nitrospinota bacterium]
MQSDKEIEYLIRARYPLLYVVSWEEGRVEKALHDMAKERGKRLICWSVTEGMLEFKGERIGDPRLTSRTRDLRDPLRALEYVLDSTEEAIFVLRDFHAYMQDPTVIRRLRDLSHYLKSSSKTLIILSPLLKIPPELEKEITVVDYGLPGVEELDPIIEAILHSVPERVRIEESDPTHRERVIEAALGLTTSEAENVFAKSIVQKGRFDLDVILAEKEQIIRKSGVLEFYHATEKFSDVGGLDELKKWLRKRTLSFTKRAREFGLPQPKGILLIGVPGCGKSLTAKAIGSLWKLPLLRLDVGKIFAGIVGSSEENIRKAIKTAEAIAPAVLWLDELEKGFAGTQSSTYSDAGTTARVFGTFVTWLQEKTSPVFVVATANNIDLLPPELLRKGRFDEIFFVDLPTVEERREIFRIHLQKRKRNPEDFDLDLLAASTEEFSGSEIEQVIISALYDAFDAQRELTTEDLLANITDMIPLSRTMEEEINALREWAHARARPASLKVISRRTVGPRKLEI